MDIDRYIRLCSSFNEEYLSNYNANSRPLIIGLRHWYIRRLSDLNWI